MKQKQTDKSETFFSSLFFFSSFFFIFEKFMHVIHRIFEYTKRIKKQFKSQYNLREMCLKNVARGTKIIIQML